MITNSISIDIIIIIIIVTETHKKHHIFIFHFCGGEILFFQKILSNGFPYVDQGDDMNIDCPVQSPEEQSHGSKCSILVGLEPKTIWQGFALNVKE